MDNFDREEKSKELLTDISETPSAFCNVRTHCADKIRAPARESHLIALTRSCSPSPLPTAPPLAIISHRSPHSAASHPPPTRSLPPVAALPAEELHSHATILLPAFPTPPQK